MSAATSDPRAGWGLLACGLAISALVHLHPQGLQAPAWIAHLAGGAFVLAGAIVLLRAAGRGQVADGLVCLLLVVFAGIGAWIALGPGAEQCVVRRGGIAAPASPTSCRVALGAGLVVVLAMLAYAARRWWRGSRGR